ncbi:MAG TPA: lipoate--protein ligase family protein [Anaerolinea thermolimosa]|uniref:Lipoate--protein ligase family protein n=1 Tax=Anaerolinea thermolimosa TaxID=229919 RepID=A0A3D1JCP2_9CHLR|nr:biotin/lipoate A/B protein ligase family protein [Anaerolinea thermolimosa]GAP05750.1 lipoate-protein ligase A [Anaerolinea thermolimosa]HCE16302.1 lipoate--protein ligase family protein [Anaerolinea thermolimosa]
MELWRLILHPPAHGAWNMAVDEAILEACSAHAVPPTLRLYAWDPPCLSLGYAQPSSDVSTEALAAQGWHLVRRPTGGRAILHTDELTYAVIAPAENPVVEGSVLESYQRIARALLTALNQLSLPARADQTYPLPAGTERNGPVCFEVPSNYEITVNGKKLIGSAQSRKQGGVLQHGTLPLTGDLTRILRGLSFENTESLQSARTRLLQHATTVEAVLNRTVSWEEAARAMISAFETTLGISLTPGELTPQEANRAQALMEEKYAHPSWTFRV